MLQKNGHDFWTEAKKIRRNKASVSSIVDEEFTADGTVDLFAKNYQHLYTSVAYDDVSDMSRITSSHFKC